MRKISKFQIIIFPWNCIETPVSKSLQSVTLRAWIYKCVFQFSFWSCSVTSSYSMLECGLELYCCMTTRNWCPVCSFERILESVLYLIRTIEVTIEIQRLNFRFCFRPISKRPLYRHYFQQRGKAYFTIKGTFMMVIILQSSDTTRNITN